MLVISQMTDVKEHSKWNAKPDEKEEREREKNNKRERL